MIEKRTIRLSSDFWMLLVNFIGGVVLPVLLLVKIYRLHFETLVATLAKWCGLILLGGIIVLTILVNLLGLGMQYRW